TITATNTVTSTATPAAAVMTITTTSTITRAATPAAAVMTITTTSTITRAATPAAVVMTITTTNTIMNMRRDRMPPVPTHILWRNIIMWRGIRRTATVNSAILLWSTV